MRRVRSINTPIGELSLQPIPMADVRVSLVGPSTDARFVISNVGDGIARDVHFEIDQEHGKMSPLVQGDYDEKLPIKVLRNGDRVELMAGLTFGTGVIFDARWKWCDENGSPHEERVERISLQRFPPT